MRTIDLLKEHDVIFLKHRNFYIRYMTPFSGSDYIYHMEGGLRTIRYLFY